MIVFIKDPKDKTYGGEKIVHMIDNDDINLDDLLLHMKTFLYACGYVWVMDKELELIDREDK